MSSSTRMRRSPTPRQLRYLRVLAGQTGTTFTPPTSSAEASREIDRLAALKCGAQARFRTRGELSCSVARRPLDGPADGWCDSHKREIVINDELSANAQVCVLVRVSALQGLGEHQVGALGSGHADGALA